MESEREREEECSIMLVCCVVAAYDGSASDSEHTATSDDESDTTADFNDCDESGRYHMSVL
jgi:hypothetical protein